MPEEIYLMPKQTIVLTVDLIIVLKYGMLLRIKSIYNDHVVYIVCREWSCQWNNQPKQQLINIYKHY